jgi:tRNA A37 threonylcarbamoyladenosine biosynthesis protein TsaE
LLAVGLEEYLNKPNSVVMIEWGEKVKKDFKKNVQFKTVSIVHSGENRVITIK